MSRRWLTVVYWCAGIGLYAGFIVYLGWRSIAQVLGNVDPWPMACMALVTLVALWLRVFKWRVALGPGANSVSLFWISKAAGEFSPGRVGELSPLLLQRFRTARVAAWIVYDRVLEMSATLGLGVAGLLFVRAPSRTAVLTSAVLIAIAMVAALYLLSQRALFESLAGKFRSGSSVARLLQFIANVGSEIRTFRNTAPSTMLITLVAGLVDVWAGILLYAAFSAPVSFALMAAVKGAHAVTSAIPITPNATGVPYLTAAILLHEVGGVSSQVLAAAIAVAVAITNIVFWLSALTAAHSLRK